MSVFDDAYDEMSWEEVCCRLPGNLAINAIKRRVNNIDTVKMLFENTGREPLRVPEIKQLVNSILSEETVDKMFDVLGSKDMQHVLYAWLDDSNTERLRDYKSDSMDIKLLFNVTKPDDKEGLIRVLSRALDEPDPPESYIKAIFRKANTECIPSLVDMLVKDKRDIVKASLLSLPLLYDSNFVSAHYKTIALKSLAKCSGNLNTINRLNINAFVNLRPNERLTSLEKYFEHFPPYKKIKVFVPMPSDDEFKAVLFSNCAKYYDRVNKIKDTYDKITKLDDPDEEGEA